MNKWSKGILIFGVVTCITGLSMMIIGIQSDGIRSFLSLSRKPVYDSRVEDRIFDKDIEHLDISLTEHALQITESYDDKIHIQYHPTVAGKDNLLLSVNDKALTVTDSSPSEHRFLGSGIEGLLQLASNYSSRFDEVILSLPKGKDFTGLTIQGDHRGISISKVQLSNATIKSNGALLRINDSHIKNSQLNTTGIINIFQTSLTDTHIKSQHEHILSEDIDIHGHVELEAQSQRLQLSKSELDRIYLDLTTLDGSILDFSKPPKNASDRKIMDNPYKSGNQDNKDQLFLKSYGDIGFSLHY